MGVLYDKTNNFINASSSYEKFITVCQSIGDSHREALAYNCIGVDYHSMAELESKKILWLAIENLGQIGYERINGDNEKLKMFEERYLALIHELKNKKEESGA